MSDYWDRKYMGIAQPFCADVHVLNVGFDVSITGPDWHKMSTEERIAEFQRKLSAAIELTWGEIENQVKYYEKYRKGQKQNE